jgi:hypothetical protein
MIWRLKALDFREIRNRHVETQVSQGLFNALTDECRGRQKESLEQRLWIIPPIMKCGAPPHLTYTLK